MKKEINEMTDLTSWAETPSQVGTPTAVLLPSRNYYFKSSTETYKITIPRAGKYHDIDPEFFSEDEGEFNLLSNDTMYMPSITKVLFATKQYPDLKSNQLFAPIALKFNEDTVDIFGQIIEMQSLPQKGGKS